MKTPVIITLNKPSIILPCSSIALALGGCAARSPAKPIIPYVVPAPSAQTATLLGDQTDVKIYDNITAYAFAVDQQKVTIGRKGWNQPLYLTAGTHDLQVWCQQGGWKFTNILRFDAQAGGSYKIGFSYNYNNQRNCKFWISDTASNKPVSELVDGVEIWEYAKPEKMAPLEKALEPRPVQSAPSYTVPIRVINKMGS